MVNIVIRIRTVFFLPVLILIVLSACSTLSKPDWVIDKSEFYNDQNYLLGHGIGSEQLAAKENAKQKIELHFNAIANSDELRSQLNIIYNQIEYNQPWLNTENGQSHILAYIPRNKAATLIQNKMLALDELTYQFFEQAKSTTDLLAQTSYINGAVDAQSRRLKLKPVLDIISSQNDTPSSYSIARLVKIRQQLQARINLQIDIRLDKLGELENMFKINLDQAGFTRDDTKSSKNHLLVTLSIEESKIADNGTAVLLQGKMITALQDQGEVRAEHQWTFTVSANDHDAVIQKSREVLNAQLNADLKQVIMDMMVTDSESEAEEDVPNQDYVDIEMPEFNNNDVDPVNTSNPATSLKHKVVIAPDASSKQGAEHAVKIEQLNIDKSNSDKMTSSKKPVIKNVPEAQSTISVPTPTSAEIPADAVTVESNITNNSTPIDPQVNITETNQNIATELDDPISTLPPLSSDN